MIIVVFRTEDKFILMIEGYQGWIPAYDIDESADEPIHRNYHLMADDLMEKLNPRLPGFSIAEIEEDYLTRCDTVPQEQYEDIMTDLLIDERFDSID